MSRNSLMKNTGPLMYKNFYIEWMECNAQNFYIEWKECRMMKQFICVSFKWGTNY